MEGTIDTQQITCDISLLKVRGSLDAHSCDQFKRCVTDCFDHNTYRLAVDMSEVNLMTCAGVGVLIGASKMAQEHRGDIVLIRPSPAVRELIDLVGLNKLCDISSNTEDAVKLLECQLA